ncbi:MAG TPA: DUF6356 family protein [Micropepsaceae bacterium]|nr:DUF6356 family protein [Micropepsaceae bacterium]
MLDRWFLAHPRGVDESYLAHQRVAFRFSASLLKAALVCFIHGLVPALFESTASRSVTELHERMVHQRRTGRLEGRPTSGSPHKRALRDIGRG